jgi:hypothetical protein
MPRRIEIIRNRFLRRLHCAVFNTVPNHAPAEVDLTKLSSVIVPLERLDFTFVWRIQDAPQADLNRRFGRK